MIEIALATPLDLDYLSRNDRHVNAAVLKRKIKADEIYLAFEDDEPIGWLRFCFSWDEIPFMNLIHVAEAKRGQGIGTRLVAHWEVQMRAAGYSAVMTSTLANETAQHFYRKLGYEDAGALLLPHEPLEILFMKRLR